MRFPFYVATGFENRALAGVVIAALEEAGRADGWECTYNWTTAPADAPPAERCATAIKEIVGVRQAGLFILLLPGGRGSYTEMGVALGRGIPVLVLVSEMCLPECIFHDHPLVKVRYIGGDAAVVRATAVERIIEEARALVAYATAGRRMPSPRLGPVSLWDYGLSSAEAEKSEGF